MADGGGDPANVLKKARLLDDAELQQLCLKIAGILQGGDRGSDSVSQLRRLFLVIASTRRRRRVPGVLIDCLKDVISQPQQGSKKFKLLCAAILRELTPTGDLLIDNLEPPVEQKNIPILLALSLTQGNELGSWPNHMPLLLKWITSGGIPVELQTTSLGCVNNFFVSRKDIVPPDDVGLICHQMARWLRHASSVSAPNPYQRQLFSGRNKGYQAVTEIDGSLSRFFFTILSIAFYSFPDQILNVYSFSMLRSWLINTGAISALSHEGPVYEGTSPGNVSFSLGSHNSSPDLSNQSPLRDFTPTRDNLDNISIASQSSRGFNIPHSASPVDQFTSSSPILGKSPSTSTRPQTPLSFPLTAEDSDDRPQSKVKERKRSRKTSFTKLFIQQGPKTGQQELREIACEYCLRVLEQCERRPSKSQDGVLLEACLIESVLILDLLCKNDKTLVPKLIEIVRRLYTMLTTDLNRWKRPILSIVQFLLNHGESVVFDPEPSCKIVFGSMVNAFYMSSSFSFEVVMFCLDNMEKLCLSTNVLTKYFPNLFKILAWSPRTFLKEFLELLPVMMSEDSAVEIFHTILDLPCLSAALCASWASRGLEGSNTLPASVSAYLDQQHRPLFSFILRSESGHGDTITRLNVLNNLLQDMSDHPRVIVCSQIAPSLVNLYFTILTEEADLDTVSKIIPVILERSSLLFDCQNYKLDIRRILGDKLVATFQKYPSLVSTHQQELIEFITGFKNLGTDREHVFINLVWSIGEFASTAYSGGCNVQTIVQYFETLEALTYEIGMQSSPGRVAFSGKLVSVLMTALAKDMLLDSDCYGHLVTRAHELIQLLKLPKWHRDKNTSLPLLLQATKLLS